VGYEGYEKLHVTVEGGIATVTIENPPINLLDRVLFLDLQRAATQLSDDGNVRVVILRSATPGFFIAHFDVGLILRIPADRPEPTELNEFHVMCELFRTMPKATIAVVEGRAGGGGSELALSCDLRFAALETAVFNQPEVALGIIPGGSGTQRLARLVGRSRALEVVLGCDDVDAEQAERWGWVNRALPADELWTFVARLAGRIASFPSHAVAEAKACVLRAEKDVVADLVAESAAFSRTLRGPGTRDAMERFLSSGGQTVEGERRLGELAGELGTIPR
jgi:enoyl-CoA hydratase/carnithine racemase